jgi:tetratricopeptide (TPR) repeat protein
VRSYTRHQLKQDQFTATAAETYSWAVEHRNKLTYAGLALAVIAAIVAGIWLYRQQQDQKASAVLGHAMNVYSAIIRQPGDVAPPEVLTFGSNQERAKAARPEFAAVVDQYPRTHSGEIARYFLGLTDSQLGNTAAAENELKQVASSGSGDLAALAKFALADIYRSQGKDPQAIQLYRELIDHPANTVAKPTAQLALAAMYEVKQPQDARKIYEDVQKEDPRGPAGEAATNRIAALKQ